MNTVKYLSTTFLSVLLTLVYSENLSALNPSNYFEETEVQVSSKKNSGACSKEEAEDIIRALPEIVEAQSHIQAQTDNKKGITIMTDNTEERGESFYTFRVGYDGNDRFETYYFLFVNRNNCSDIRIADALT